MKCNTVRSEIEEMEAGALLSDELRAHLQGCTACSAFQDERAALRQLMGSLDAVYAPPNFDWKLRARLAEARVERRQGLRGALFIPGAQAMTLAASFVIIVVAFVVYKQTRQQPFASQPTEVAVETDSARAGSDAKALTPPTVEPQQSDVALKAAETKPAEVELLRQRGARNVNARPVRTDAANPAETRRIFTNDLASRDAAVSIPSGADKSLTDAGPVISVPTLFYGQPARLQFEDRGGSKRTLSLEPVTFGGQDVTERRDGARMVPVGAQGIW